MERGRPRKDASEYANAQAVESAMLRLRSEGKSIVETEDIVRELGATVPNARVVFHRGMKRLDSGINPRVRITSALDQEHHAVRKFELILIEGRKPGPISAEDYDKLPEHTRQFFHPIQPSTKAEEARVANGLGAFLEGLSRAALPNIPYADLQKEIQRREKIRDGTYRLAPGSEEILWKRRMEKEESKWFPPRPQPKGLPRRGVRGR